MAFGDFLLLFISLISLSICQGGLMASFFKAASLSNLSLVHYVSFIVVIIIVCSYLISMHTSTGM